MRRWLASLDQASLTEAALPNGRRADVLALGRDGSITIIEIKSSVADFQSDQKWPDYLGFCDRFYFAVDDAFPQALIPETAGLLIADGYGAAVLREAPAAALPSARRRALTLKIARRGLGRLHALEDPELSLG